MIRAPLSRLAYETYVQAKAKPSTCKCPEQHSSLPGAHIFVLFGCVAQETTPRIHPPAGSYYSYTRRNASHTDIPRTKDIPSPCQRQPKAYRIIQLQQNILLLLLTHYSKCVLHLSHSRSRLARTPCREPNRKRPPALAPTRPPQPPGRAPRIAGRCRRTCNDRRLCGTAPDKQAEGGRARD